MTAPSLVVRSRRTVTPEGIRPAAVHVHDGVIQDVRDFDDVPGDARLVDAGDLALMPGVVDSHVHVNEPGRTEWEGFETATRAAAAGGVTTIGDMPLNSLPVTTTPGALAAKRRAAAGRAHVDYVLWGGVIPGNAPLLEDMLHAGAPGFKCFLVHSGIDEFPNVTEADLRTALPVLARHGAPLLVHAELPGPIEAAERAVIAAGIDPRRYDAWLRARPHESEDEAVALLLALAEEHGARVHVVHLSSAESLPLLAAARARGVAATVETCPHYLTFAAEEIPDGRTDYKCAPPIREAQNRDRLWAGVTGGIDLVVSDHSPCPAEMKALDTGDYGRAWGGISSLQLALPAFWTGARARGLGLERVAALMCASPARLCGLAGKKGALLPGLDADLVVWDPEATFQVDPALLHHRHRQTPYAGRTLHGVVHQTYLRGELVFDAGRLTSEPRGRPAGGR